MDCSVLAEQLRRKSLDKTLITFGLLGFKKSEAL